MCRAVMELRKLHGLEKMSGGSITLFNFSERAKILTIFSIQTFLKGKRSKCYIYGKRLPEWRKKTFTVFNDLI